MSEIFPATFILPRSILIIAILLIPTCRSTMPRYIAFFKFIPNLKVIDVKKRI